MFLVACRTGTRAAPRTSRWSCSTRARGRRAARLYDTMTSRFLPIGEMRLRDVRIEADEVLAPPGPGFQAALGAIDVARTDIAAIAVGLAAQALDTALAYTRDRAIFGGTVLDLQAIQFALADVETDIVAGRLLYERAAALLGTPEGRSPRRTRSASTPTWRCRRRSSAPRRSAPTAGSMTLRPAAAGRPGADAADGRRHARDPARRDRARPDAALSARERERAAQAARRARARRAGRAAARSVSALEAAARRRAPGAA